MLTFDENGDMVTRMLHGPAEDSTLVQENAAHALLWALTDNLGSVRDLVDDDGDVLNHIVYDSFGKIVSETNANITYLGAFQGAELDRETGLQLQCPFGKPAIYLQAASGRGRPCCQAVAASASR
ncbi:MAG: hypothetical protein AB7O62_25535 [Pirellulales bacterium]